MLPPQRPSDEPPERTRVEIEDDGTMFTPWNTVTELVPLPPPWSRGASSDPGNVIDHALNSGADPDEIRKMIEERWRQLNEEEGQQNRAEVR